MQHGRNLDAKAIFKVACLIDSGEARDAYLNQVCGDEGALYNRVVTLLKAHDDGSDFLESPAPGVEALLNPRLPLGAVIVEDDREGASAAQSTRALAEQLKAKNIRTAGVVKNFAA